MTSTTTAAQKWKIFSDEAKKLTGWRHADAHARGATFRINPMEVRGKADKIVLILHVFVALQPFIDSASISLSFQLFINVIIPNEQRTKWLKLNSIYHLLLTEGRTRNLKPPNCGIGDESPPNPNPPHSLTIKHEMSLFSPRESSRIVTKYSQFFRFRQAEAARAREHEKCKAWIVQDFPPDQEQTNCIYIRADDFTGTLPPINVNEEH